MNIAEQWIAEDSAKYKGLSIEEKARKVIHEMGETGQIIKVAWLMEIQKALNAQIEECAKILEEGSKSAYEVKTDHRFRPGRWASEGLCTCGLRKELHLGYHKKTRKQIAKEIRALAAPSEEGKENKK